MSELDIARWKRYGKDRLYINGKDGHKVGWVDLLTGERTLSDPRYENAFTDAVNNWYVNTAVSTPADSQDSAGDSAALPTALVPVQPTAELPVVDPAPVSANPSLSDQSAAPWHDIACHVPGQAARDQALGQLAAMKERTKTGAFIARARHQYRRARLACRSER